MMEALFTERDLQTLVEVGKALWMDPRECQLATLETVSAVTLLELSPDRALEKAAAALLERVTRRGGAANFRSNLDAGLGVGQSFFRLLPEDRFLLVALHLGRWSYARLARIFGETVEQVETHAWNARLRYVSSEKGTPYPAGAAGRGTNCPEYDARRPWTQRFLDEEIAGGRERLYFQNHLMACLSCREALNRCRETYYAIDRALPRISAESPGDTQILRSLESVTQRGLKLRSPSNRTFVESLAIFVRRTDIRYLLIFFGLFAAWRLLRSGQ